LKTFILILSLLFLPKIGNSNDILTLPYSAELTYESLSKNGAFYVVAGKDINLSKENNLISPQMLQQVWKINNFNNTSDEISQRVKEKLESNDHKIIFECEFNSCGGFEFRFNSNILNMPEMFVNLNDYKFITAEMIDNERVKFISYIISVGEDTAYIQINQFGDDLEKKQENKLAKSLSKSLSANFNDNRGSIIIEGLKFKPGSAEILESDLIVLSNLANFLILNKNEKIILVGHTDASGSIKGNIKLSKDRAKSVQNIFIKKFNVNPNQITINGVGFLSPIASNNTKSGREKNRRVEVIIVPRSN